MSKEFQAYVDANFTIALVSDRGSDRCTGHAERFERFVELHSGSIECL